MRCPACRLDNPSQNRHCESCGTRLAVPCSKCGSQNSTTAQFCGACGASLEALSPHRELGRPHSLIGERKHATVLFADIVNSTQLVAALDPEQAMEQLQPAVSKMCVAVQRFGGTVVRTLGDGILALFGVPRAQEGHALLACEAALAMREAFPHNEGGLKLRIGLHSGEVVAELADADLNNQWGVHGATIHLASRLQQMAEPNGICLTEECYTLVRAHCHVRHLGRLPIKGFPETVEIYGLLGLKPAVESQQFRGRNLTSFRGRNHEMTVLQSAWSSTQAGDTKVVGISGPPGSGKSRLCYEFAESCRDRLVSVVEVRALTYGHARPLQPVLEFIRLFFGVLPTDDPIKIRSRIFERLFSIAPTLTNDLELLYEFLGVPVDNPLSSLAPKTRQERLFSLIRETVRRNGVTPSIIIFEDLHWLDEASDDFVEMLVDAVNGTRTMMVLNYRKSYTARWITRPYYKQLSLPDLNSEEIGELVEELIGNQPELSEIRRRVVSRSGGNPFFAEELVRSLVDNGALLGTRGSYQSRFDPREGILPPTIYAVIGERIDHLPASEKGILQISATIGNEFPLIVLEYVSGKPLVEIECVLRRLSDAQLVQEQPRTDGRQFAFRHPLIQEVTYATQLKARRNALHSLVATALESHCRQQLDEFAGLISHHHEAAGQLLEAAKYSARAATWIGTTNSDQAAKHWHRVRLLLQSQPRSEAIDKLRIMASARIVALGWRGGMTVKEAKPFIDEALSWARTIDDRMMQTLLLAADGRICAAGAADIYVERVREALSLINPGENVGRTATLNAMLSQAYTFAGMLKEALTANTAALQQISAIEEFDLQFLGFDVEQWVKALRGRILIRLAKFADARRCLDKLVQDEGTILDPAVRFLPHLAYLDLAWFRHDARLAEKHASKVAEIAHRSGVPYLHVCAHAATGLCKLIKREFSGAVEQITLGLELARRAAAGLEYEPEMLALVADANRQRGDTAQAIALAKEAIDVAHDRGARLAECRASITYGSALVAAHGIEKCDEAEHMFCRAKDLIRMSGAKIYAPLLRLERARISALVSAHRC
jgi:class 3 adenylate cyclase/tetratricopeptide (TPR) repeat protein